MRVYFEVYVDTDTQEHAMQVMSERCGYDEEYEDKDGRRFDYQIEWGTLP